MDEIRSSPRTQGTEDSAVDRSSKNGETSTALRMKKDCLAFMVSVREGFEYVKAFFVGQAKKLTAKSEEEAAVGDLKASKMQVEAADAAEDAKTRLYNSA